LGDQDRDDGQVPHGFDARLVLWPAVWRFVINWSRERDQNRGAGIASGPPHDARMGPA
jgi:hypothetical protein